MGCDPLPFQNQSYMSRTSHEILPFAYLETYFRLQYITYNDFIKREWKINEIHHEPIRGKKVDLPSLRFSLANPGPWLLESSEELLNDAWGRADARGSSQSSAKRENPFGLVQCWQLSWLAEMKETHQQNKKTWISHKMPTAYMQSSPLGLLSSTIKEKQFKDKRIR